MKKNANNTEKNAANNNAANNAKNTRKNRKGTKATTTTENASTTETTETTPENVEGANEAETAKESATTEKTADVATIDEAKSAKTVTEKVAAIVGLVKRELLTNRSVVACLYDNRGVEELTEIASVLFCDVTPETSRKVAINAGLIRYVKLMPYVLTINYAETGNKDYKCAKLYAVANGIYKAVEIDAIDTLELTLTNYYNGGGSKHVEFDKYYTVDGVVIDSTTAKNQIETEKAERKEKRAESTAKRDEKAINNADILTLLTTALKKAESDKNAPLQKAIEAAIKAI